MPTSIKMAVLRKALHRPSFAGCLK